MGFWKTDQRVNEGVHLEINGIPYDIIVREIMGPRLRLKARVEIRKNGSIETLVIQPFEEPRVIEDGLDIIIPGLPPPWDSMKKVRICYHTDYPLKKRM